MATLTPQVEIKHSLKQGEFAKVVYAIFFFLKQVYWLSIKHHIQEKGVKQQKQSNEDVTFVGRGE